MDRAQREVKQLLPVSAVLSLVNCYLCFPKCCSLLTRKAGPANLWQNNCSHLSPSFPLPSPSLSLVMSHSFHLKFTLDSFDKDLQCNFQWEFGSFTLLGMNALLCLGPCCDPCWKSPEDKRSMSLQHLLLKHFVTCFVFSQ